MNYLAPLLTLVSAPAPVEKEMIDMSPSLALVIAVGAFVTAGVYLLLERSLTRVLLGVILIGNGINLMFMISGGRAGGAPITGVTPENEMSDPLPQAMVLTAIVITMGLTAFVVAMAYRSWQLLGHDEVQDDLEDRRIARIAARNAPSVIGDDSDGTDEEFDLEDVAAEMRDETSDSSERDNVGMAGENALHYTYLAERENDPQVAEALREKAEWWAAVEKRNQPRREDQDNELTERSEKTAEDDALEENTRSTPESENEALEVESSEPASQETAPSPNKEEEGTKND